MQVIIIRDRAIRLFIRSPKFNSFDSNIIRINNLSQTQ